MAKSKSRVKFEIIIPIVLLIFIIFFFANKQSLYDPAGFNPDVPYKTIEIPLTVTPTTGGCNAGSGGYNPLCGTITPIDVNIPSYNQDDFLGLGIDIDMTPNDPSECSNEIDSVMWDTNCPLSEGGNDRKTCWKENGFITNDYGPILYRLEQGTQVGTKTLDLSPGIHKLAIDFKSDCFAHGGVSYGEAKAVLFLKATNDTQDTTQEEQTNQTINTQDNNIVTNNEVYQNITNSSNNSKGIFIIVGSIFVLIIIYLSTKGKKRK